MIKLNFILFIFASTISSQFHAKKTSTFDKTSVERELRETREELATTRRVMALCSAIFLGIMAVVIKQHKKTSTIYIDYGTNTLLVEDLTACKRTIVQLKTMLEDSEMQREIAQADGKRTIDGLIQMLEDSELQRAIVQSQLDAIELEIVPTANEASATSIIAQEVNDPLQDAALVSRCKKQAAALLVGAATTAMMFLNAWNSINLTRYPALPAPMEMSMVVA